MHCIAVLFQRLLIVGGNHIGVAQVDLNLQIKRTLLFRGLQQWECLGGLVVGVGGLIDPEEVADAALGPLATPETRQTLSRAESRPQALALLLMAPEFLRR